MDLSPPHPRPPSPQRGEGARGRGLLSACDSLPLGRRKHFREIVGHGCKARRYLAFSLLGLDQLVRDIEGRQDRGLMRLHQRSLTQHLLQRLVQIGGNFTRVLGREVGADGVLFASDHHPDGVLLRRHLCPPLSRACSSKKESRCTRSWTRVRAPSTRWRSDLFSDSSSVFLTGPPRAFSSDSAFWARERQPASSSATSRTMASS